MQNNGSPQALTNITRSLKRLAQNQDIPVVGTTQVLSWKLGNKKSRRVTADSIGYTYLFRNILFGAAILLAIIAAFLIYLHQLNIS